MPSTRARTVRGAIRRPEYAVTLELADLAERAPCPACTADARTACTDRQDDGTLLPVEPHPERMASIRRHYRIEAPNLDDLADTIEYEVRAALPNRHIGVRLAQDSSVWVRIGWASSQLAGTWRPA